MTRRRGVHHRVQLLLQRAQLLLHVLIFSDPISSAACETGQAMVYSFSGEQVLLYLSYQHL